MTSSSTPAKTAATPRNLKRHVLDQTTEEASLADEGFHASFRQTCATRLFTAGRDPVHAQRRVRHHSPAFTLSVYVHRLDGDVGARLSAVGPGDGIRTPGAPLVASASPR